MSVISAKRIFAGLLALIMAFGLNLVSTGQANAAQAITIDTTQIDAKIAPGLVFASEPDAVDVNIIQIGIDTTNTTYKDLQITGFSATLTVAGKSTTYSLANQDLYRDNSGEGRSYYINLTNEPNQGLKAVADLSVVTKVVLKGTVRAKSTVNGDLAKLLAAKGLTVSDVYVSGNGYVGTSFTISGQNKTAKDINLTASKISFDGISLDPISANLNVTAGDFFYWEFAKTNQNLNWNRLFKTLTATFTVPKASTLDASKVVLPAGLISAPTSTATWWYSAENNFSGPKFVNRSRICMNVKNSSAKDISVQAKFTWSVNGVPTPNSTSQVATIAAGATECLGGYADDVYGVIGDARFGKSVTVTGTVTSVTPAQVDTKGITLPRGYSIDASQTWISYSSETNTTSVVMAVRAPDNDQSVMFFYLGKLNTTVKLGTQVSYSRQYGGPGVPVGNFQMLNIGPLSGDLRVGKNLVLTGKIATATSTEVDSWSEYTSGVLEDSVYCFVEQPALWTYSSSTNKTTVTGYCFNTTTIDHTVSLSGLKVKVTNPAGVPSTYSANTNNVGSIALKARAGYTAISITDINGDVRKDGGWIVLSGALKLIK